jgi:hypothetical protein
MLSRINAAISVLVLRTDEWIGELSPGSRRMLIATLLVLLTLAAWFGLLPTKHLYNNPHALFNW